MKDAEIRAIPCFDRYGKVAELNHPPLPPNERRRRPRPRAPAYIGNRQSNIGLNAAGGGEGGSGVEGKGASWHEEEDNEPPLIRVAAFDYQNTSTVCALIEFRGLMHIYYLNSQHKVRPIAASHTDV
ncbi:unnamed protein product [Protopolystoma xenopodis]|uniref:Uncharacterized protein n=1 Tax=Protopolystoma xenopodis TaxID=117903 RepID=A0A448XDQ9_9PLAT|nr:unnamed protein product [Protopolystoma xenopodis]